MSFRSTGLRLIMASSWFMVLELLQASHVPFALLVGLSIPLVVLPIAVITERKSTSVICCTAVVGDAVWLMQYGHLVLALGALIAGALQLSLLAGSKNGDSISNDSE